jgi:hypothetical protein
LIPLPKSRWRTVQFEDEAIGHGLGIGGGGTADSHLNSAPLEGETLGTAEVEWTESLQFVRCFIDQTPGLIAAQHAVPEASHSDTRDQPTKKTDQYDLPALPSIRAPVSRPSSTRTSFPAVQTLDLLRQLEQQQRGVVARIDALLTRHS